MAKPKLKIVAGGDADAIAIGEFYRRAEKGDAESLGYYWDCGHALVLKKALPEMSACWLEWVEANKASLGFGERNAQLLMKFAIKNTKPASDIRAEDADILRCNLWGRKSGRHDNLKGGYEWYTPQDIIDAARKVMGGIDLDPASCAQANAIVQAEKFYTEEDNGLEKPWTGRLFINPPFAHPTVKHFADKLVTSFDAGEIDQATWLSNATVDVDWWQRLARAGMVCFHRHRVRFYGPEGDVQPPTLGQSIIYLGNNKKEFREEFGQLGVVMISAEI